MILKSSKFIIALVLFFVTFVLQVSAITISGTVTDNHSSALEGVLILLSNVYARDTADANGNYSLDFVVTAIKNSKTSTFSNPLSYRGASIKFSIDKSGPVTVNVFSVNGRQVATKEFALKRGVTTIPSFVTASGVYIYQIKINNRQYIHNFIYTSATFNGTLSHHNFPTEKASKKIRSEIYDDTLTVSMPGFITKYIPINYEVDSIAEFSPNKLFSKNSSELYVVVKTRTPTDSMILTTVDVTAASVISTNSGLYPQPTKVVFSYDLTKFAIGTWNRGSYLYDRGTMENLAHYDNNTGVIEGLAFSHDGTEIIIKKENMSDICEDINIHVNQLTET